MKIFNEEDFLSYPRHKSTIVIISMCYKGFGLKLPNFTQCEVVWYWHGCVDGVHAAETQDFSTSDTMEQYKNKGWRLVVSIKQNKRSSPIQLKDKCLWQYDELYRTDLELAMHRATQGNQYVKQDSN
jgi:hypothetical protein